MDTLFEKIAEEGYLIREPTSDRKTIEFWAKTHGAHPAERLPEHVDGVEPVLCFIFHRSSKEQGRVIPISWDEFFSRFDLLGLSFIGDMDPQALPIRYEFLYGAENPFDLPLSA